MLKITKEWLREKNAYDDCVEWFLAQAETDGVAVVRALIAEGKLHWANWLIVRIMDYRMYVSYAVYAAEKVLRIYETKYPKTIPQLPLAAAKKCIDDPSEENKAAAYAAAATAYAASAEACAASYAAAEAAAYAASYAASYAAAYAAAAAAEAAAENEMMLKILTYGLSLLEEEK